MRTRFVIPFVAILLVASACGSEDEGSNGGSDTTGDDGATITVTAFDFGFDPSTVSVDAGEEITIRLDNTGDAPHTLTSDDLDIDISTSAGGDGAQTVTAPGDGTFSFRCTIHPDRMTGEIVVGSGGAGAGGSDTKEGPAENDDGYDY